MSWLEGTIEEFGGGKPQHRELRMIRTSPEQEWNELHFFHLDKARSSGYPDAALAHGRRIRFEPDPNADRPRVLRFAPYVSSAEEASTTEGETTFLNPYHFVPLVEPPESSVIEVGRFLDETPPHDRFARLDGERPAYSGRILCRLTTEGPVVVGAAQTQPDPKEETEVTPFTLPDPEAPDDPSRHRPAISATTLRGLLSSLIETASCSAMRVLADQAYVLKRFPQPPRPIPGSIHGSVARVSEDLVPFHAGRQRLTLAERIFGFVERDGPRALSGRVRVGHGLVEGEPPEGGWYDLPDGEPVTLKALSSPKPPSPALYFGQHGYLSKADLDLSVHPPQGRKVYLHHRREDVDDRCYETKKPDDKPHLKLKVKPLKERASFLFHLDFTNLSRAELGFLLYALRPTQEFRHKIGLGKPIGLGRVVIDPLVLGFVDRQEVYGKDGLFAPRYASIEWLDEERLPKWEELPGFLARRYRHERRAHAEGSGRSERFPAAAELRRDARDSIPESVRCPLELLGDPARVEEEVTYPVLAGQDSEGEHYRWFVENDKHRKEAMPRIAPGAELPALTRYRRRESERPGGGRGGPPAGSRPPRRR